MGTYTSKEVIKRLQKDGWIEVRGQGKGSHRKFRKTELGMTIVPKGVLHPATYRNIAKKAGWQ